MSVTAGKKGIFPSISGLHDTEIWKGWLEDLKQYHTFPKHRLSTVYLFVVRTPFAEYVSAEGMLNAC